MRTLSTRARLGNRQADQWALFGTRDDRGDRKPLERRGSRLADRADRLVLPVVGDFRRQPNHGPADKCVHSQQTFAYRTGGR